MLAIEKMAEFTRRPDFTIGFSGSFKGNKAVVTERFFQCLTKSESFVFEDSDKMPHEVNEEQKLDAPPFEVFTIEHTNGFISIPQPTDDNRVYSEAILVNELGPDDYEFFILLRMVHDTGEMMKIVHDSCDPDSLKQINYIANSYIRQIQSGQEGIENMRKSVKAGTGKNKKNFKIRRVIHIRAKSKESDLTTQSVRNRIIDWSHSWLVRGHWRKINGIGKDRHGNYNISGMTYVVPHKKGEGDLVKKVRVVV